MKSNYRILDGALSSLHKLYTAAALDSAFCGDKIDSLPPIKIQLRVDLYGAVYWLGRDSTKTWNEMFQFVDIADSLCLTYE